MTSKSDNSITELQKLKEKLDTGQMSVIIGAGFSRNVSDLFPLWTDLLEDMVLDLYGGKINVEYREKVLLRESIGTLDNFRTKKVEEYIKDVGYLNLVELYIEKYGYREIVTSYIEERTPQVQTKGEKKYLYLRKTNTKVELTDDDLLLHKKIINLPWNNVYTTNYDELLDIHVQDSLIRTIDEEIKLFEKQIEHNENEIKNIRELRVSVLNIVNNLKTPNEHIDLDNKSLRSVCEVIERLKEFVSVDDIDHIKNKDFFNKLKSKERELKEIVEEKIKEIALFKSEIDWLKELRKNSFNIVTKAAELSISKNKNIVKLHGSLRKENEAYGFDGDITTQYIFSKSDYESYPNKHEAFTQLMRISLLQESFCLIGFSGEDPNFLEWVKWVRDVLKSNQNKDSKIYFISTGKDDFSSSKKLFFKNHNIVPIFLGEEDIQSHLLRGYNKVLGFQARKKSIDTFLDYLSCNHLNMVQLNKERVDRLKYMNIWKDFNLRELSEIHENNIKNILKHLKPLDSLKRPTSFILNDQIVEVKKIRFITYVAALINNEKISIESRKLLFKYSLIALNDLNLFISNYFNQDSQEFLNQFIDDKLYIENRSKEWLLKGKSGKLLLNDSDYGMYCDILKNLFCFDFNIANTLVEDWDPDSFQYKIKKACLLSYFDYDKSFEYLKNSEPVLIKSNVGDVLLYNQVYRLFAYVNAFQIDEYTKRFKLIKELESFGYISLSQFFNSHLKNIEERSAEVKHYGNTRFSNMSSIRTSIKLSNSDHSQAILNGLITMGNPLVNNSITFLSTVEWYQVFGHVFKQYPYPCLFYSLQFEEEKFIRRIAQDYMYYDEYGIFLDSIVPKLLNIYSSELSNSTLRRSILFFCSEVLVAVKSDMWNPFVIKILQKANLFSSLKEQKTKGLELFIDAVVTYTDNEEILNKIFEDCIQQIEVDTGNDYPTEYIYNLLITLRNRKFSYKIQGDYYKEKIDLIITKKITVHYYWKIIYCLFPIFSQEQVKKVLQELDNTVFKEWGDISIVYLLFDERKLVSVDKFKLWVLHSKMLFNSGIIEIGGTITNNFIRLSHFQKIRWTNKEKNEINKVLLSEWKKVKNNLPYPSEIDKGFPYFKDFIREMYLFLSTYKNRNNDIFKEISELHFEYYGYRDLREAFINYDNGAGTVNGLLDLSNRLFFKEFELENKMLISIILNNILMFKKERIEESINFLRAIIEDKNGSVFLHENQLIIEAILKKYYNELPSGCDKIYIMLHMIKIAKGFKKLFGSNDIVESWLNVEKTTRFNKNYIN